jgi:hypothetical protein
MLSLGMLLLWFPISVKNMDLGNRFRTVFGGVRQFRALSAGLQKPVVTHHAQIYGLVHGATTHENSTTMSLYGYDLV